MEEYEFILIVLEEYLSHYNSIVTCLENYDAKSFKNAYDEFFEQYLTYKELYENLTNESDMNEDCERNRFRFLREKDFKGFIKNLKQLVPNHDIESIIQSFYLEVNSQDVINLETELAIYPYLLKQIRNQEENAL
ncbi:MAG: hypothetical protein NC320_01705 [Clostridium sp.]|nr:hypothetical protein [Clostridium sp.]